MAEHCGSLEPIPVRNYHHMKTTVVPYKCYKEESPRSARTMFANSIPIDAFVCVP